MRILASATALFMLAAQPCAAQDYYGVMATAKHGNGYIPGAVVAGWEKPTAFTVISFTPNGDRKVDTAPSQEWKAVLTVGPKRAPKDDDTDDDRYQDRRATTPKAPAPPPGPPVVYREVSYSSLTCPALLAQMAALKPLASFEFNLPDPRGNQDGPNGDGHGGFDLWVRVGDGELTKQAGTAQSQLGQWFLRTADALSACPAQVKPGP